MKDLHPRTGCQVQSRVTEVTRKQGLVSLGSTSQHLQGADGRYSDNDSLRSYYK